MSGRGAAAAEAPRPWWLRERGWHLMHLGLSALAFALLLYTWTGDGLRLAVALAGVLLLTIGYVRRGGPAFGAIDPASTAYPLLAWPAVVLVTAGSYQAGTVATVLVVSQTWALMTRTAATYVVSAGFLFFGATIWAGVKFARDALPELLATVGGGWVFAIGMGWFIDSIARTSRERGAVIEQLRATQAELASAQRLEGIHAERERLSGEIHDTLAQGFTSVVALSRAARLAQERDDGLRVRERLDLIEATALDNLAEARVIVAELSAVSNQTLVEALERLAWTVQRATSMHGGVEVLGIPVTAGSAAETALLRVAQECLANTRKHSAASAFEVVIDYADARCIRLCVSDDGVGFDPNDVHRGFGLGGIEARIVAIGGKATVDAHLGRGTRICVQVPQ